MEDKTREQNKLCGAAGNGWRTDALEQSGKGRNPAWAPVWAQRGSSNEQSIALARGQRSVLAFFFPPLLARPEGLEIASLGFEITDVSIGGGGHFVRVEPEMHTRGLSMAIA